MDQTGTKDIIDVKNKSVLIIGSGIDLEGRKLKNYINNFHGIVIRLNKLYGNYDDVGDRTDIIFSRWSRWIEDKYNFFPQDIVDNAKQIIYSNQYIGISKTETDIIAREAGVSHASQGLLAVCWALHRGAKEVILLGYGYDGYSFNNDKIYCSNAGYPKGLKDNNKNYDFAKEREYFINQPKVKFI